METLNDVARVAAIWLLRLMLLYCSTCFVAPIVSVYQEYKLWAPKSVPSLSVWAMLKVYIFNVIWMMGCLVGAVIFLPKFMLGYSVEKETHEWVEGWTAILLVRLFIGDVVVRGAENLPAKEPGTPAPIYIANHASQIDLGVVYELKRCFKWIAKSSIIYVPGVGQTMYMSRHIFINRKGKGKKSSVSTLYEKSNAAVQSGTPMFVFPQGTRTMAKRLPFKDGAFNIALTNKSSLVPVSIDIPLGVWNYAYPLPFGKRPPPVVLTVHKVIPVKGDEDKDELKKRCYEQIFSVLPDVNEIKKNE